MEPAFFFNWWVDIYIIIEVFAITWDANRVKCSAEVSKKETRMIDPGVFATQIVLGIFYKGLRVAMTYPCFSVNLTLEELTKTNA